MRKQQHLLSIIIPVYNVESYLKTCLDSVLSCRLDDCELLLSLGDSSDNSNEICWEYEARYSNLRCLHQRGRGLSDARNCAMDAADGEYILFLDSDDAVETQYLDDLIQQLRERRIDVDVVVTDYVRYDHRSGQSVPFYQIGVETPVQRSMDFLPQMLSKRQCFWNVWRYVYKRSFLKEHQIRFLENRLSEDVAYTSSVFLAQPEIAFVHCPYYIYHVGRGGSLMDRPTFKRLEDTVYILKDSIERLRASKFPYAATMIAQFQFEYLLNLALTVELDRENREAAKNLYRDWRCVLQESTDPVVRFAAVGIGITGLTVTAECLHLLKVLRRTYYKMRVRREKP